MHINSFKKFHASLFLVVGLLTGCDSFNAPQNYDDCILKNMRGVNSDRGAALIHRSCRDKFPEGIEDKRRARDLRPSEIYKLTGRAGLSYGNHYSGNIYNGNSHLNLTRVTVRITAQNGEEKTSREYSDDVDIAPQTTEDFGFDIVTADEGAEYSWSISSARGYVVH